MNKLKSLSKYLVPVFKCLLTALGIYFLIVATNSILRPYYLDLLNKDIELKFVATARQNEESLSDNIRINNIAVNGKSIDLSKVKIPEESRWEYDSENDFLFIYNARKPTELTLTVKDANNLTIGMVQEVGSGIVEIYLNGSLWKTVDLYKDTDWENIEFVKNSSIMVFPEENAALQLTIVAALWILAIILSKRQQQFYPYISAYLIRIAEIGFLSMLTCLMISAVQYDEIPSIFSHIRVQPQSFLKSTVFIFICLQTISILSGKIWIGFSFVSVALVTASFVSKEKIVSREVPLFPWDFSMLKEAASVVENYELAISFIDIAVFVIIILLTIILIIKGKRIVFPIGVRVCMSLALAVIITTFVSSGFMHCCVDVYNANNYYSERGFVSAFLEYMAELDATDEPDDYSRGTMETLQNDIIDTYVDKNSAKSETPTIIAVMSESFWDIERLDTIAFSQEVLPNFKALKNECSYGNLFTHVLSGGTVVSEFEFLTGFSGEFFPSGYMVYGNSLNDGFASAVSLLRDQGYNTTAIHPYLASNYNRETAYANFGFDKCIFEDSFTDVNRVRNYISDESLYDMVTQEYEKNASGGKPQFIFSITMQNHGGYWEDTIYENGCVDFSADTYSDITQKSVSDFAAGLHESDRALGKLVDYFRNVDEDVIIIYFGDHMSDAGPKDDRIFAKTSWAKDTKTYDYETHIVPFLVWSNTSNESNNMGLMEVGELLPEVFDWYNIKSSPFWEYIQANKDVYAASDTMLVVEGENEYSPLSEMTDKQKEYYKIYELLQYDYIWGNKYAEKLWAIK